MANTTKPNTAQVTVEVYTTDIKEHIERRIAEAVEAQFENSLSEMISARVAQLVDDISHEHIRKAVEDAITDGWQQTNTYGEPVGPKVGLKGRIAELLSKQEGSYDHRKTRAEKIAEEAIDAALRAQFGKEIEAARKQFKEKLDGVIAAKFTETIKSALGLR